MLSFDQLWIATLASLAWVSSRLAVSDPGASATEVPLPAAEDPASVSSSASHRDEWRHAVSWLLWFGVTIFVCRGFFWEPMRSTGQSMAPLIHEGTAVIVDKRAYGFGGLPLLHLHVASPKTPRVGDVVAVSRPSEIWFKRVAGVPGDRLAWSLDGEVALNGHVLPKPATRPAWPMFWSLDATCAVTRGPTCLWREVTLPSGWIFVVGLNPSHSLDSRQLGPMAVEDVVGRVAWVGGHGRLAPGEFR